MKIPYFPTTEDKLERINVFRKKTLVLILPNYIPGTFEEELPGGKYKINVLGQFHIVRCKDIVLVCAPLLQ